jgi:4-diphosphocytidyl-2-C-methyl-D-erythritol kinase
MEIRLNAYAKLNISLDIVSKMDDGYHSMKMVMQSIELHDEIKLACKPGTGINIRTDLKYLPGDDRNIAAKAAAVFFGQTGISGYETSIDIKKNIPVCAGLGGGSTDGAAVLRGLDQLFETHLGRSALEELGSKIGSDVPFCIAGGTALAEGRGEVLHDLKPLPDCIIVICKPAFAISTPELFSKINCEKIHCRPDTEGIIDALEKQSLSGVARRMYNVFETVLPKGCGAIDEIKESMLDYRATGTVMTGTGSAVFGIFSDRQAAESAFNELKSSYQEVFLTAPIGRLEI